MSTVFFNFGQDSSRPTTASSNPLSTLDPDVDDLYIKYKKLQKQLEFLKVQEEYIKDEQKNLKKELLHAQEEVKRIQSVPLVIGQFLEAVDQNTGIVGSTTGEVMLFQHIYYSLCIKIVYVNYGSLYGYPNWQLRRLILKLPSHHFLGNISDSIEN